MKNWGREGMEHSSSDDGVEFTQHAILEHSTACVWTNLRFSGSFQSQSPELTTAVLSSRSNLRCPRHSRTLSGTSML